MSSFRVALSTIRLAFKADPVDFYQYLGDDVIVGQSGSFRDPSKPLWLNLGYWKDVETYPEAAVQMAILLGDAAALGARDRLLDVGFGFAEQDFFWLERYGVPHITGLNITPMQVERARARVAERNLGDRLDLRLGSATDMPFEASTFTKVTALECAFHFVTRELFFAEAFRVLKPGGRLALADGVPKPGFKLSLMTKFVLRHWATPIENFYDRDAYREKLLAAGFTNVQMESIGDYVFPGTHYYMDQRRRGVPMDDAKVKLTPETIASGLKKWEPLGLNDYLIITADKPA